MEATTESTTWLLDAWTARFISVFETMAGERPALSWKPSNLLRAPAGLLWWEQLYSIGPGATLWIGAPEAGWSELGGRVLRSAGIESTEAADARNTYLEIISQVLSGCAQDLAARLGRPVSCQEGAEIAAPPDRAAGFECEISAGESAAQRLYIGVAPGLLGSFETGVTAPPPAEVLAAPPEAAEPAEAGEPRQPQPQGKTMDLLLEVELPVSVSFGRAQLPLKDVLKLTTGSIVELNRAISEPVEVIVNNCVIARGEVVVVDGNYGVRIQEIVSRERRLKTVN
jgi:flagellar motor switch protein FliN/FliY